MQLTAMVRTLAAGGLVHSDMVSRKVIAGCFYDRADRSAVLTVAALGDCKFNVLQLSVRGYTAPSKIRPARSLRDSVRTRVEAAMVAECSGILDPDSR